MRYLQVETVKEFIDPKLLARLTDDAPSHSIEQKVIDNTKIEAAILWAEAYVDAQLVTRFVVPIDLAGIERESTHRYIKESVLEMTIYRLYARVELEGTAKEKRESADNRLARILSGDLELIGVQERPHKNIRYREPRS